MPCIIFKNMKPSGSCKIYLKTGNSKTCQRICHYFTFIVRYCRFCRRERHLLKCNASNNFCDVVFQMRANTRKLHGQHSNEKKMPNQVHFEVKKKCFKWRKPSLF